MSGEQRRPRVEEMHKLLDRHAEQIEAIEHGEVILVVVNGKVDRVEQLRRDKAIVR